MLDCNVTQGRTVVTLSIATYTKSWDNMAQRSLMRSVISNVNYFSFKQGVRFLKQPATFLVGLWSHVASLVGHSCRDDASIVN